MTDTQIPPATRLCKNCKFFARSEDMNPEVHGSCRRRPPTAANGFPHVMGFLWCAEHKFLLPTP